MWEGGVKECGELGGIEELFKKATGPGISGNSEELVSSGNLSSSSKMNFVSVFLPMVRPILGRVADLQNTPVTVVWSGTHFTVQKCFHFLEILKKKFNSHLKICLLILKRDRG